MRHQNLVALGKKCFSNNAPGKSLCYSYTHYSAWFCCIRACSVGIWVRYNNTTVYSIHTYTHKQMDTLLKAMWAVCSMLLDYIH